MKHLIESNKSTEDIIQDITEEVQLKYLSTNQDSLEYSEMWSKYAREVVPDEVLQNLKGKRPEGSIGLAMRRDFNQLLKNVNEYISQIDVGNFEAGGQTHKQRKDGRYYVEPRPRKQVLVLYIEVDTETIFDIHLKAYEQAFKKERNIKIINKPRSFKSCMRCNELIFQPDISYYTESRNW